MSVFKTVWGLLFRLFPCPTKTGIRPIGNPGPESPVLATCNFHLTVQRLERRLRGTNVWLLVCESKGVNVWCAAAGQEFNTRSVVSGIKTSGIADRVDHKEIVLPPLGAPGIRADEVTAQTGWKVKWGPVHAEDIPRYLATGFKRTEDMKRATYPLKERLDTALGSLFPFYLLGAVGFLVFGPSLLLDYLLVGAAAFFVFFAACPWLPGQSGLAKSLWPTATAALAYLAARFGFGIEDHPVTTDLVMAMVIFPLYGLDLGGLSSKGSAYIEPILARLGVGDIGNVALAGSERNEILFGARELTYDQDKCVSCRSCFETCPQGVWEMGDDKKAVLARRKDCTACLACQVQCRGKAIGTAPTGRAEVEPGSSPKSD